VTNKLERVSENAKERTLFFLKKRKKELLERINAWAERVNAEDIKTPCGFLKHLVVF